MMTVDAVVDYEVVYAPRGASSKDLVFGTHPYRCIITGWHSPTPKFIDVIGINKFNVMGTCRDYNSFSVVLRNLYSNEHITEVVYLGLSKRMDEAANVRDLLINVSQIEASGEDAFVHKITKDTVDFPYEAMLELLSSITWKSVDTVDKLKQITKDN